MRPISSIRDTAQLETFARALEQAGMAETLRGEGPITVFAPTDAASGRPSSPHRPATSHRSTV
jgi:uncharacterized surface protein with fasciclin (FAS1) repeats